MNSYYSNIYWHFTGSPKNADWNKIFSPKDIQKFGKPKHEDECVSILASIISSKTLLAKAVEKIDTHIYSDPFCCVTDIPVQNLQQHRSYYGNIAIGFKAGIIHQLFNPVFYLSKNLLPARSSKYEELSDEDKSYLASRRTGKNNVFKNKRLLAQLIQRLSIDENQLGSFLFHHFKITEFSENAADSFYPEREWRKIGNLEFERADIAAIIASEKTMNKIQSILRENRVNDVPVLTWEVLGRL